MSATPQCGLKIAPNLAPSKQYLKPDDARKGYHVPTMPTRIIRAKAKRAPMSSVSLIAIELEGLAVPGEGLKIILRDITRVYAYKTPGFHACA